MVRMGEEVCLNDAIMICLACEKCDGLVAMNCVDKVKADVTLNSSNLYVNINRLGAVTIGLIARWIMLVDSLGGGQWQTKAILCSVSESKRES